jgi:hypothetical protein
MATIPGQAAGAIFAVLKDLARRRRKIEREVGSRISWWTLAIWRNCAPSCAGNQTSINALAGPTSFTGHRSPISSITYSAPRVTNSGAGFRSCTAEGPLSSVFTWSLWARGERYKQILKNHDLFVAEGMATRGPSLAAARRAWIGTVRWAGPQIRQHPYLRRSHRKGLYRSLSTHAICGFRPS